MWKLHLFYPEKIYKASYIYNRISDESTLVRSFDNTIFKNTGASTSRENAIVFRWEEPIRFYLLGNYRTVDLKQIERIAAQLSKITGLKVIRYPEETEKMPNVRVHFNPREDLKRIGDLDLSDSGKILDSAPCVATIQQDKTGHIKSGKNFIPIDQSDEQIASCILEEFAHIFGPNHDTEYRPSVFGVTDMPETLSINDKILVRTLYDKRLKPGMTRDEAMPIVREIIPELVKAVKERGEQALYQR